MEYDQQSRRTTRNDETELPRRIRSTGIQSENEQAVKGPEKTKNLKVYHGVERYNKQWEIAIKNNLK